MLLYKEQSIFIGLVLFTAGLLTACHSTPKLVTSPPSGIGVGITDDLCPNVLVKVGQQITWTNQGTREHIIRDITGDGKSQFDSGLLRSGDTFTFPFSEPQTYKYQCSVDGSMIGTITVSDTPVPSATDSSNQTSSSGNETAWQKYANAQVGFSLQYPSYWQEEDLPDENEGQIHHIVLRGPEGGVEIIWGTGLGGACPEGYQSIAVAKGNWPACYAQKEDGTDFWSLASQSVGETSLSGLVYTNDTAAKSREVVLQVISTLTIPGELFSSDQLGLCFSYPLDYTQIPYNDAIEIAAPDLPGSDVKGLFWLEISDSYNRTAEEVADQEMTYVAGLDVGRWTVTLDGEQALVLDGMPGQELQRRVYIVRQQTLYILAFWPTRSENKDASDQMEVLYSAVTSSWAWSPCSASE